MGNTAGQNSGYKQPSKIERPSPEVQGPGPGPKGSWAQKTGTSDYRFPCCTCMAAGLLGLGASCCSARPGQLPAAGLS